MAFWALAAAVTFGAALLRGLTGFGSPLIMVPVLALLYSPVEAVSVSVLLETVAGAYLFPQGRRATDWRLVGVLTATGAPAIVVGTYALTTLEPALLKVFIGSTSIAWALLLLGGRSMPVHRWRWTWPVAGVVGGFFQGSVSMGGPPAIILLASRFSDKVQLRSTMITLFTVLFLLTIAAFAARGLLSIGSATLALSLLPFHLGALWVGTRLFDRVPSGFFRKLTLVAVVLASMPAVVVSVVELATRR